MKVSENLIKVLLVLTFVSAFAFRFVNLWYSEFQADEIEAVVSAPLLTQSKPPMQFILSGFIFNLAKNSDNFEFFVRLPFFLAGFLVVIVLYKLLVKAFDKKVALLTTFLVSQSGLLIAFSRVAQYQSFVILLSVVCAFLLYKHFVDKNNTYLILCGALSGLAVLFHYDSLSFIIPIVLTLLFTKDFKKLSLYLLPFLLLSSLFFIPFVLHSNFSETLSYLWNKRISSGNSNSFEQSITILNIYHPREFIYALLLGFGSWIVFGWRKLLKAQPAFDPNKYFELWFLISFLSFGVLIKSPLTHIYNFFIPLFVLASVGLVELSKKIRAFNFVIPLVLILSTFSFNYMAFIDTREEYPWQKKNYLFGSMFSDVAEKKQVKGVFGFPYNRGWRYISKDIRELPPLHPKIDTSILPNCSYDTNEKKDIADFYINYYESVCMFYNSSPDFYIFVKRPQSLVNTIKVKGEPVKEGADFAIYTRGTYKVGVN